MHLKIILTIRNTTIHMLCCIRVKLTNYYKCFLKLKENTHTTHLYLSNEINSPSIKLALNSKIEVAFLITLSNSLAAGNTSRPICPRVRSHVNCVSVLSAPKHTTTCMCVCMSDIHMQKRQDRVVLLLILKFSIIWTNKLGDAVSLIHIWLFVCYRQYNRLGQTASDVGLYLLCIHVEIKFLHSSRSEVINRRKVITPLNLLVPCN